MAEHRAVRMGIDVGGTYTKCVAMDNLTHEIIGKNEVKTTHDDKDGVAAGVVQSFKNCMAENDIAPEDVVFVAHSTTQATNAFIEGDVASVGVIGVAGGGLEGFLAKRQLNLKDIVLDEKVGRKIPVHNRFLKKKEMTDEKINAAIKELCGEGSQVIVASMAFGVDNMDEEVKIHDLAEAQGLPVSMASDITKLYGLTRRTRTAAINASILPKMMATANATESSVRNAGVTVPLMIMRGDGGVMEISEMRKRPILTALSGPAASVMGSLMYLRASNAIYFEVGGTTTNIGVIKNGRPGVDYAQIGGHDTYINSLDVRILGCAGGSMVRINDHGVEDVGPRSAHIAGCEYACFTPEEEIDAGPLTIEMLSPKPGDPSDYVAVKLASGKRICFTNTDAANVLGLIDDLTSVTHGRSLGLTPHAKMIGLTIICVTFTVLAVNWCGVAPEIRFPGGLTIDLGVLSTTICGYSFPWLYIVFCWLMIAGLSNAVNLTDGLDGLAGGTSMIAMLAMAAMAFLHGDVNLSIFCTACAGACLGFLWFNCYPASIFMGDTGSLALGAAFACTSIMTNTEVVSLIIGGLFIVETLSVMIQVVYFHFTHKRVFLMAPIHHHFEKKGWAETKVVIRFWIIAAAFGAVGLALFFQLG